MNYKSSYIDNIIYLDLLTTGNSDSLDNVDMKKWERIVEIHAIKYKGGNVTEYRKIINPKKSLSLDLIEKYDYLNKEALENAPTIKDIFDEFKEFVEDLDIICWNHEHEGKFFEIYSNALHNEFNNKFLDLGELVAIINPCLRDYSSNSIKTEYLEKYDEFNNTINANHLILVLNRALEDLWLESSMFLPNEFLDIELWEWYKYIGPQNVTLEERKYKQKEHVSIIPVNYDKYEELFRDKELWQRTGRGYSVRQQQIDVSKSTREMLQNRNITLIEAPTGIGKSLSYLLPSVIYSYKTGEKVVISTNTKGLQTQLIKKDIPNLLDVLCLNNHVNYISMKGKNNYICMDKFKLIDKPLSLRERLGYVFIYRYLFTVKKGDVENINEDIRRRFSIDKLLEECLCDSEYCDIKSCEYKEQCYYAHEVEKLKEANIIVVNHSLLLKWPYKADVEIKNLIIDEAHNLKKEVYDAFESEVTSRDIIKNVKEIYNNDKKSGYLLYLSRKFNDIYDARNLDSKVKDISFSIQEVTDEFEKYIKSKGKNKEEDNYYDVNECINLDDKRFARVKDKMMILLSQITLFNIDVNKSLEKLQCKESLKDDKRLKILTEKVKNMDTIKDIIENCMKQSMNDYCYSYGVHKNFKWWGIKFTPLNVAEEFYTKIVDPLDSGLFISATLTTNGNYNDIKRTLGLDKCEENKKRLVELEPVKPVFDYLHNSIIYAPTLNCEPSSINEFVKEARDFVLELTDVVRGNILMLFTSNARLRKFEEVSRASFAAKGISILTKKSELEKLKKRDGKYIFLGSRGFFEGVDIPGDTLSTVILDKVPNINGHEPLYETLIKKAQKERNDYFTYYNYINYPIVSIDIKQIYGRLMRSEYDYGAFFILSKFEQNNSNTKKLQKELYNVEVVRGDAAYIKNDLLQRYKMWSKNNIKRIVPNIYNNIDENMSLDMIKDILEDEYNKNHLLLDIDNSYINSLIKTELKRY